MNNYFCQSFATICEGLGPVANFCRSTRRIWTQPYIKGEQPSPAFRFLLAAVEGFFKMDIQKMKMNFCQEEAQHDAVFEELLYLAAATAIVHLKRKKEHEE